MGKNIGTAGIQYDVHHPTTFIEAGKEIIRLPDAFATKVSCDVFKYLSIEEFQTYFIDKQDATSFRAFYCMPLGFSVAVRTDAADADVRIVDFILNDHTRHSSLIRTREDTWILLRNRDEVGKIETHLCVRDEMRVRAIANNAFNVLKCAFLKKAKAELRELHLQFGRPIAGHWADELVLVGAITSRECKVTTAGSEEYLTCHNLSMLTEKLFL